MARGINFDGGAHWYRKDGVAQHDATLREARKQLLYPSVTSIDKDSFPNLFLERWKLNQLALACAVNYRQPHENDDQYCQRMWEIAMQKATDAQIFGKALHEAMEKWPAAPSAEMMPWYVEFDKWMVAHAVKPLHREHKLLHHGIGVAGQTDLICAAEWDHRTIVDYKTQDVKVNDKGKKVPAFYDSWVRQLAFYEQADRLENGLVEPSACVSLIIDSNPGGLVYDRWWTRQEIQAAYEEFLAGVWLWCRKRGYWPVGEWKMERI